MRKGINPNGILDIEQDLSLYFGQEAFNLVKAAAAVNSNVLIVGRHGSTVELAAEVIHYLSDRRGGRFVVVQCEEGSSDLEKESLVGRRVGAEGVVAGSEGLIEAAHRGTLFLSEMSLIPPHIQTTLMRTMDRQAVTPEGSLAQKTVDVRFIAATNLKVEEQFKEGRVRPDFYRWISVLEIHLRPLNERREDIPKLAAHFLKCCGEKMRKPLEGFEDETMNLLVSFDWNAEIRQFESAIEHAAIVAVGNRIAQADLPNYISSWASTRQMGATDSTPQKNLREAVENFEREYIAKMLINCNSNKEETAIALGISLSSLYRKMEELGIATRHVERR